MILTEGFTPFNLCQKNRWAFTSAAISELITSLILASAKLREKSATNKPRFRSIFAYYIHLGMKLDNATLYDVPSTVPSFKLTPASTRLGGTSFRLYDTSFILSTSVQAND
jgi:hypothetical protein